MEECVHLGAPEAVFETNFEQRAAKRTPVDQPFLGMSYDCANWFERLLSPLGDSIVLRQSKKWVKSALVGCRGLHVAARLSRPRAVILMYHSIVEDPRQTADSIGISQSRASFEWQMRTLAERFNAVTIGQVVEFASQGRPLPPHSVVVTFDDGFADNHDVALPILKRYRVPATFYIMVNAVATGCPPWYCRLNFAFKTTAMREWKHPEHARVFPLDTADERTEALTAAWNLGAALTGSAQEALVRQVEACLQVEPLDSRSGLMMNWDQVRVLHKAGHTIGGHTLSHPNLAHVSLEEARTEIIGCKDLLEEKIGQPIMHFSYPHPALNPQWSPQTLQITREAGFRSAVLTTQGSVRPGDEPLSLLRIPADHDCHQWIWDLERAFLRDRN